TMANINIPANDVPAEQAPAFALPTRTDDQILTLRKWVPVGKSNYVIDFWDTMRYDSTIGIYSCQLDEQWFNLHKDILIDALQILPINDNNPFVAPPSSDAVIEYVNTLGYPCQDILCFRFFRVSFIAPTSIMLRGFGKNLFVGKDGREVFGMPIPDALLTDAIKRAPYYGGYLAHVVEYQRYLDGEHGMAEEEAVPEPPAPKATKEVQGKKRKLVKETSDAPSLAKRSKAGKVVELSLKEQEERNQGLANPVVFREPDSRRFQPLPERRTPMTTEPSRNVEYPSLDAELALSDSEMESDKPYISVAKDTKMEVTHTETPVTTTSVQDEGQDGSNHGKQDEGQARSNPEVFDASTQQNPEQMDEEFTTTAYPNVQENFKLPTED
ncbi:hypothetical protein Tco_1417143, partial [Tanacetum coccineum]